MMFENKWFYVSLIISFMVQRVTPSLFKPKTWFTKQEKKPSSSQVQELKQWFAQFDEEVLLDMLERFEAFERKYHTCVDVPGFNPDTFTPGGQKTIDDTLQNRLPILQQEIAQRDSVNIEAAKFRRYKRKLKNAGFSEREAQLAVSEFKKLIEDAQLDAEKAIEQLKLKQKTLKELQAQQKHYEG